MRGVGIALCACQLIWMVGCAVTHEQSRVAFREGSRSRYSSPSAAATAAASSAAATAEARDPKDRYLLLKPKKNSKPGKETVAFAVVPFHLWSPFRIEVAAGVFDGKLGKLGIGQACLELDERDSAPLVFYNICLRDNGVGGLNVFSFNAGAGQANFATSELELAFEADGDDLLFEVRPRGSGAAWTQIHSVPFTGQTVPLVPSVGSFRTDKGAKVGFDEVRILANGDAPEALSPEREVVETLWDAVIAFLDATYRIDDFSADFVNSAADVAAGRADIATAIAATKLLSDGKPKNKALKKLKVARKRAKKAAGSIEDEKAGKSYDRLLETNAALVAAIMALEPDFGLPGAP